MHIIVHAGVRNFIFASSLSIDGATASHMYMCRKCGMVDVSNSSIDYAVCSSAGLEPCCTAHHAGSVCTCADGVVKEVLALATEQHPHSDDSATPEQRRWCTRLGMDSRAIDGWLLWHVDIRTALLSFFSADILCTACLVTCQAGVPVTRYVFTIPNVVVIILKLGLMIAAWRAGPRVFATKFYLLMFVPASICSVVPFVVTYLGPVENVPFDNTLKFVALTALYIFSGHFAGLNGAMASEQPPEPRTSLAAPAFKAALMAARGMDSLTDMSFIRVLIYQVCRCPKRPAVCRWQGAIPWQGVQSSKSQPCRELKSS